MSRKKYLEQQLVDYLPKIRRIVSRITHERGLVDDITQECCVRIIEKEHLWRGEKGSLPQWMNAVVRNLAIRRSSEARRHVKVNAPLDALAVNDSAFKDPIVEERIRWVLKQYPCLSQTQKLVLHLRYFEERSVADIARQLKMQPSTVASHLSRGVQKLRTKAKVRTWSALPMPAALDVPCRVWRSLLSRPLPG